MNYDFALRAVAGLAALVLIGPPAVAGLVGAARKWGTPFWESEKTSGLSSVSDMRIVLDLASRLRENGNTAGVHLCQQLLDVMLAPAGEIK